MKQPSAPAAAQKPKLADDGWIDRAAVSASVEELRAVYEDPRKSGVLGLALHSGETVDTRLRARKKQREEAPKENVDDAEVIDDGPFLKAVPLAETATARRERVILVETHEL